MRTWMTGRSLGWRVQTLAGLLLALGLLAGAHPVLAGPPPTCGGTYTTVGETACVVPAGATSVTITAVGGAGGSGTVGGSGGQGDAVTATFAVGAGDVITPGETIYIEVGGSGGNGSGGAGGAGGANGGAGGGNGTFYGGGGGGGASDVRACSDTVCTPLTTANDSRILVAGGGGGGGAGINFGVVTNGGNAGTAGGSGSGSGGGAGGASGGGAGGSGQLGTGGSNGSLSSGGAGGTGGSKGGGGGGGGYYGGGGGGGAPPATGNSGGGGGGSDFVKAGGTNVSEAASRQAPSVTLSFTSSASTTTTTAANATATYSTSAQSVTLNATVTSGAGTVNEGMVTFTIKTGPTIIGTPVSGDVSNGQASASFTIPADTGAGAYTIDAAFSDGTDFTSSSDATHDLNINQASTRTTAANAAAPYSGNAQQVTLSAAVSSPAGSVNYGVMTFSVKDQGGNLIGRSADSAVSNGQASVSYALPAGLAAGTYTIVAAYTGNADLADSSDSTHTLTIGAASTTTRLTASQNPSQAGQAVTFTASVSCASSPDGGTVTFEDVSASPPTTLGSAPVSGGVAVFKTSSLSVGAHSIVAVYGGNSSCNGSTSNSLQRQVLAPLGGVTLASSRNPANLGQAVTFTATAACFTAGESITFLDGQTAIGTGTLNAQGVATLTTSSLSAGRHLITASYAGDGQCSAAMSAPLTQTVNGTRTLR